ncbi:VOC family protein [Nocardia jejuensis]|uniref:VOC family protein n=1 Tax=Nocardia jejuensis TaxID=328049 RepID=UPI0008320EB7|nr:VOC family protein [Nocardia jejuensis]
MPYSSQPGDPVWADLLTSDPEGAIVFYRELFGWQAEISREYGGYITFSKNGKAVAGAMTNDGGSGAPDAWTVHLAATDAEATAHKAAAHGGSVLVPATAVGELGAFAVLGDSAGVRVGVWESGTMPGFGARGQVSDGAWSEHDGVPSWFALHTREYENSLVFYRDVFDCKDLFTLSDAPEYRYTTLHSTSPMLGGIMDASAHLPEGVPGYWTVYFGAENVDASVQQVLDLGGSIVSPAIDAGYGRMAAVADPTGARFSLGGNPTR